MNGLFMKSEFDGDISKWNVQSVEKIQEIFCHSKFTQDLSDWKPLNLQTSLSAFTGCNAPIPYWAFYEDNQNMKKAIDNYELSKILSCKENNNLKIKI